ncbi:MAG: hypothetical protein KDD44_03970 [Bdellovibrionales bacterium]|nr:hypothetical protein [Bdellovibrionales bacterium]
MRSGWGTDAAHSVIFHDKAVSISGPVMQVGGDGTRQSGFPLSGDPGLTTLNDVRAQAVCFRQTPGAAAFLAASNELLRVVDQ